MARVLVLAAAAAVYPALLAGVILILTRPNPLPQLAAFFAGGLAVSVTAGILILFVLDGTGATHDTTHTVGAGVDLAVGALSLAAAWWLWKRHPAPKPKPADGKATWLNRTLARGSVPLAAAVGVVLNLPSVWYLAALKEIGEGNYTTGGDLLLILAFNLVMFALVEAPLVWYVISPTGAARAVASMDTWFHAHARNIGAAVAGVIGVYLVIKGILAL